MKNNQTKNLDKTIYFTDINNHEKLNKSLGIDFMVFDRKILLVRKLNIHRNVFNYFANKFLEQEFIATMKDKKVTNILYQLNYNEPDKILTNIQNNIIPKIKTNKKINISFRYIARKSVYETGHVNGKLYDEIIILDI